jgi:hypothetical protein
MDHSPTLFALGATRRLTQGLLADLEDAEWTAIPVGFRNHLLWNLGHVTYVQRALAYGLSGLPLDLPEAWPRWFGRGSDPRDWEADPDPAEVRTRHDRAWRKLEADLAAGRFTTFTPFRTEAGVALESLDQALAFNNVHEGLHLGIMIRLKKALRA